MKFLSAEMENQLVFDVEVRGEITLPTGNIKGRVILDGANLLDVDIPVEESTSYTLNLPPIQVLEGEVKNIRVQLQSPTQIGMFKLNKTYHIINDNNLDIDHDSVRLKLGVTEQEVFDSELNLEVVYLNSFRVFKEKFFEDLQTKSRLRFVYGQYLTLVTAIGTIPKLVIRLAKKDATENGDFTRLANASDLDKLKDALGDELQNLLDELQEYLPDNPYGLPIFEFVTIRPDLITGV